MKKHIESDILRIALATANKDSALVGEILKKYPNRTQLLRAAISVILSLGYYQAEQSNRTVESYLDSFLLVHTSMEMEKTENGDSDSHN